MKNILSDPGKQIPQPSLINPPILASNLSFGAPTAAFKMAEPVIMVS